MKATVAAPLTPAGLRAWRAAAGLSQAALAALLGVTQNTVSRWETGRFRLEHAEMLRLALIALERWGTPVTGRP